MKLQSNLLNPLDLQDILLPRTKFYDNNLSKALVNYIREILLDSENVKLMNNEKFIFL